MDSSNLIPSRVMKLKPSPFGDLLRSPEELHYGRAGVIEVGGLMVSIGDRPIAKNLRRLYKLRHEELPEDVAVFDRYNIWVLSHSIGVVRAQGNASIAMLGYEADFPEDDVYTIDLLPQTVLQREANSDVAAEADLHLEGGIGIPAIAVSVGDFLDFIGPVKLALSSALKLVGRLKIPTVTPLIQAVGVCSSRCHWCFTAAPDKPLLGQQIMVQTVLTHFSLTRLDFKVRGYGQVRTGWLSCPARYETDWLDVHVDLED